MNAATASLASEVYAHIEDILANQGNLTVGDVQTAIDTYRKERLSESCAAFAAHLVAYGSYDYGHATVHANLTPDGVLGYWVHRNGRNTPTSTSLRQLLALSSLDIPFEFRIVEA